MSNLLNTAGYDIIRRTFRSLIDKQFGLKQAEESDVSTLLSDFSSSQVRSRPGRLFRFVFFPKEAIYDEERDEMLFFPTKRFTIGCRTFLRGTLWPSP